MLAAARYLLFLDTHKLRVAHITEQVVETRTCFHLVFKVKDQYQSVMLDKESGEFFNAGKVTSLGMANTELAKNILENP